MNNFLKSEVAKYGCIFTIAFVLNAVWENAHAFLYVHYQGEFITGMTLLRASLFDAVITTFIALLFFNIIKTQYALYLSVFTLVVFAIGLEWWAIETSRWAYGEGMPIIPFLNTGLTPTIQLGLLGYISIRIALKLVTRV